MIKSITDLWYSRKQLLDYSLVENITQHRDEIRYKILENFENLTNSPETITAETPFYHQLLQKSIDIYPLSLYSFGLKEVNKLFKLKSKPLAQLHKEFFKKFEAQISKTFFCLNQKYETQIKDVHISFEQLDNKYQELVKENEFLQKQLIDYKNSAATEIASNQISTSLLQKEIFAHNNLKTSTSSSIGKIQILLPNFEKIMNNSDFIKKLENIPKYKIDKEIYEKERDFYDPQESLIIEDLMRLTGVLEMKTPQQIEIDILEQEVQDLKNANLDLKMGTIKNLQDRWDKFSNTITDYLEQNEKLKEDLKKSENLVQNQSEKLASQNDKLQKYFKSKISADVAIQWDDSFITTKRFSQLTEVEFLMPNSSNRAKPKNFRRKTIKPSLFSKTTKTIHETVKRK